MKAKVLVTGGAGYIGSVLVADLLQAGFAVTVIDNFMYRQSSLTGVVHDPHFHVVDGDVRHEPTMKRLLKDADIVIPLAALVGAASCDRDPVAAETCRRRRGCSLPTSRRSSS